MIKDFKIKGLLQLHSTDMLKTNTKEQNIDAYKATATKYLKNKTNIYNNKIKCINKNRQKGTFMWCI